MAKTAFIRFRNTANLATLLLMVLVLLPSIAVARNRRPSRRSSDRQSNNIGDETCNRLMDHIYRAHVVASHPPDVVGLWTSTRCEVRPGPEFILRKYRFYNSSHFEAQQFYYGDADCQIPIYSLNARGTYGMEQESWTVPGGTEVDYQLWYVSVVSYSSEVATYLGDRVNKTCPGYVPRPWKAHKQYQILNFVAFDDVDYVTDEEGYMIVDRDCTSALDFALHELQLMRLEERRHHFGVSWALFLGDIHTDRHNRQMYRPTAYQQPMVYAETAGCPVCRQLMKADDFYPPTLRKHNAYNISLSGEWFSNYCETRPGGMFLTRRLLFSDDQRSWEGFYYHFGDALCRQPHFTVFARGSYVIGQSSENIAHANDINFKVMEVKVTAQDPRIAKTFNDYKGRKCGKQGKWRVGMEQDVTWTNGCGALGISVPHVEYEIIKIEKEHHKTKLFFGQRPTGGTEPETPKDRPTSFQPPLVRCVRMPHSRADNAVGALEAKMPNTASAPWCFSGLVFLIVHLMFILLI